MVKPTINTKLLFDSEKLKKRINFYKKRHNIQSTFQLFKETEFESNIYSYLNGNKIPNAQTYRQLCNKLRVNKLSLCKKKLNELNLLELLYVNGFSDQDIIKNELFITKHIQPDHVKRLINKEEAVIQFMGNSDKRAIYDCIAEITGESIKHILKSAEEPEDLGKKNTNLSINPLEKEIIELSDDSSGDEKDFVNELEQLLDCDNLSDTDTNKFVTNDKDKRKLFDGASSSSNNNINKNNKRQKTTNPSKSHFK